jgi:hypothetical protein
MMACMLINIETLVTITTGRMLTDFQRLHDAIQFASGQSDDLASIGVVMMAPRAKAVILAQYPELPQTVEGTAYDAFLADCRGRHGDALAVSNTINPELSAA